MKKKIFVLLIATFSMFGFTGCSTGAGSCLVCFLRQSDCLYYLCGRIFFRNCLFAFGSITKALGGHPHVSGILFYPCGSYDRRFYCHPTHPGRK